MFAVCAQAIACHDTTARGEAAESAVPGKHKVPFEKVASTREIRGVIAQQLKAHYDLAEPISDRLAELLEQLAQRMNERESEIE
jgi:hypothetical protein